MWSTIRGMRSRPKRLRAKPDRAAEDRLRDEFAMPQWQVEPLENRCMLAGDTFFTAETIAVAAGQSASATEAIDPANDVDIYAFELQQGETAHIRLDADGQGTSFASRLNLYAPNGAPLDQFASYTDLDPAISIQAPVAGTYFVGVSQADVVYDPTIAGSAFGGTATADYDIHVTRLSGTGTLGGQVFEDANADGIQDPGESGLNGVRILLYDDSGILVGSALTTEFDFNQDQSIDPATERGWYFFTGLEAGNYTIEQAENVGLSQTFPQGTQRLFGIPYNDGNAIVELDPRTGAEINRFAAPVPVGDVNFFAFDGLAFDGESLFLISPSDPGNLYQLDPNTGAVIDVDPIASGGVPVGSGVFSGLGVLNERVYIIDFNRSDLIEFDPVSDQVTNILPVDTINGLLLGTSLTGISNPDRLLATDSTGSFVAEIDPTTGLATFFPSFAGVGLAAVDTNVYSTDVRFDPQLIVNTRTAQLDAVVPTTHYMTALGGDDLGATVNRSHAVVVQAGGPPIFRNFGNRVLLPNLLGTSFRLSDAIATSGSTVTFQAVIRNNGELVSTAAQFEVRLSADDTIDSNDFLLGTFIVPFLFTGNSEILELEVDLPPGFTVPTDAFIGIQIDPTNFLPEGNENDNANRGLYLDFAPIRIVPAIEFESNDTPATATPIPREAQISGSLASGTDVDHYVVTISQPGTEVIGGLIQQGRLTVEVTADVGSLVDPVVSLFGPEGNLLVTSNNVSVVDSSAGIVQFITSFENGFNVAEPTPFVIQVTSADGSTGSYTLTTRFEGSTAPFDLIDAGFSPADLVRGDFNRDGIADIAVANSNDSDRTVFIYHGLGDGTFHLEQTLSAGFNFTTASLIVDDFNNDGFDDLAIASTFVVDPAPGNDIGIFLGVAGGRFQPIGFGLDAGGLVRDMVSGDFNEDGFVDIAALHEADGTMSLLAGNGTGAFAVVNTVAVGVSPSSITSADLLGRGTLDLIVTNGGLVGPPPPGSNTQVTTTPGNVALLFGGGDGTFDIDHLSLPAGEFQGPHPAGTVVADFNHDGLLDLAFTDQAFNSPDGGRMFVMLRIPGSGFADPVEVATGVSPQQAVATDVNADGHIDLITTNARSNDVSILLGDGIGSFTAADPVTVGANPNAITVDDFNHDGRVDLAIVTASGLNIFPGLGNGSFLGFNITSTGLRPEAIATADFDGDGTPDVATANTTSSDVSILLSSGNLTLQETNRFATGFGPADIVAADFNGDGRIDLATANSGSDLLNVLDGASISVLLGIGDGTFAEQTEFAIPLPAGSMAPATVATSLTAVDIDGDGVLDLITNDLFGGHAIIFLGSGDGTFTLTERISLGEVPGDFLLADLNGDQILDIASVNLGFAAGTGAPGTVSVLLGNPDGTFAAPNMIPSGNTPVSIITADFNNDSVPDLAVTHAGVDFQTGDDVRGDVFIYLGVGDGSFGQPTNIVIDPVFRGPNIEAHLEDLLPGDFNGDGNLDLIVANFGDTNDGDTSGNVAILLGGGDGTFTLLANTTDIAAPGAIVVNDFNNDGRDDLAVSSISFNYVGVLEGLPDGSFRLNFAASNLIHSEPIFADINSDGRADALVISRDGEILVRLARDETGLLDAPRLANPDRPAQAMTVLEGVNGPTIAAIDRIDQSVTLYQFDGDTSAVVGNLATGQVPSQIAAADLNGDGREDLAVLNLLDGTVDLYLAEANGNFTRQASPLPTVSGSSDLRLVDLDGNGTIDVIAVNQLSGDISVHINDGNANYTQLGSYRAGDGPYLLGTTFFGDSASLTREGSLAIETGDFNNDGRLDTIAINRDTNTAGILLGGEGGFVNVTTLPIDASPTEVVVNDFSGDGNLDVAILSSESESLIVMLGDGTGNFSQHVTLALSGNLPTGLSTLDVNRDTFQDLVVSNQFGDLLILPGNGDGTFEPFLRVDRTVSLALNDLNNDQQTDEVLLSNSSLDQLSLQEVNRLAVDLGFEEVFEQDRDDELLAPGAVSILDIDGDGMRDLVVANTGGNNVLVYLSDTAGNFDSDRLLSIFTGTNPTGITSEDFNADGFADLVVANRGSNDVSVLFSQTDASGQWSGLSTGPRLEVGSGPVSAEIIDRDNDGMLDLLVTNSLEGTISVLPGVGGGFFDDVNRLTVDLPGATNGFGTVFEGGVGFATLLNGSIAQFDIASLTSRVVANGVGARSVAPLDFDGDGRLELVVAGSNGSVSVFFNSGDAFFADPNFVFTDPNLQSPSAVALARLGDSFEIYVTDEGEEIVTVFQLEETFTDLKKFLGDEAEGGDPAAELLALVMLETEGDPEQLAERGIDSQFDSSGFDPQRVSRIVSELIDSLDRVGSELLGIGNELLTVVRQNEAGVIIDVLASHVWKWNQFLPELLPGPTAEVSHAVEYTWNVIEELGSRSASEPVDEPTVAGEIWKVLAPWAKLLESILEGVPQADESEAPADEPAATNGDSGMQSDVRLSATGVPLPVDEPRSATGSTLTRLAPGAIAAMALARAGKRRNRLH